MEGFSKKINEGSIKMIVTADGQQKITHWNIYLYKGAKDSILLDKFEFPEIYEGEPNMLKGDIRLKIIIGDVTIKDNTVYLMLYNFGKITLNTYQLSNDSTFNKTTYFITEVMTGSYMNFGEPEFYAKIKPINQRKILIYADKNGLLVFDKFQQKIKKIILDEKSRLKDTQKHFRDFDIQQNSNQVSDIIQSVINNTENNISKNFAYKGFIDDINTLRDLEDAGIRDTGMTYFFCQTEDIIHIIQYDNFDNEWIITEYTEEEIKQEMTID